MDEKSEQKTPSDALREWTRRARADEHMDLRELESIADRIDNEMVELPKSADGKIWTGRETCFWTNAEQEGYHEFDSLTCRNGTWFVEDINNTAYTAESVSLERPDSFERIADEIDEWLICASNSHNFCQITDDSENALRYISDRIRKLAKERAE